jgi:cation diffusion facilitator CzcD-associated flavoprotein CzcO
MKIAIIGSGFAGLCMAIKLKSAGFEDFVIYEKAGELGGTWRDNTYPGCACDVMSHLYSFSFYPNPDWSRNFSGQAEIWAYMKDCAEAFQVPQHIKFNSPVTEARYDEAWGVWKITTAGGETDFAHILVAGAGGLSLPGFPEIEGLRSFAGAAFHSAEWDHAFDLYGKKVAVIGTGASAIQIVPNIAGKVAQLYLFQRTPPWVLPKREKIFSEFEKKLFRSFPFLMKLYRAGIYWRNEFFATGLTQFPWLIQPVEGLAKRFIRHHVHDPALQEKLIPDYRLGCKRVLLSNDYYPSLNRENVHVKTKGISRISRSSIIDGAGEEVQLDAIIYATGFRATEYLSNIRIAGRGGHLLKEVWEREGEAFLGTAVSGFPNLFTLTGPNTGLGHNSVIHMIESQVAYIMDCLKKIRAGNLKSVEVKKEVQTEFNAQIQKKIARTVWQTGGCKSWYQDPKTGKNITLWPGYTFSFRLKTRRFDLAHYEVEQG